MGPAGRLSHCFKKFFNTGTALVLLSHHAPTRRAISSEIRKAQNPKSEAADRKAEKSKRLIFHI
jgi:hypothetical protein